jgi:hypothetical protein
MEIPYFRSGFSHLINRPAAFILEMGPIASKFVGYETTRVVAAVGLTKVEYEALITNKFIFISQ